MTKTPIRVLLVEDDEDDYVIFHEVISQIKFLQIELAWVDNYNDGFEAANDNLHDVYMIDYLLKGHTGLELLRALKQKGVRKPLIILTGQGDHAIDVQAMEQGAADYLEKARLTPALLERVLRYVMKQFDTMEMLRESEKQLRHLSLKLINAQEDERKRIAKDLHDSIGSNLAAVKFEIQKQMAYFAEKASEDVEPQFQNLIDTIQNSINETRRICSDLRPSILDDLGIIMAINWYCRKFPETYSNICININLNVGEEDIPEPIKVVIFRVLQEALNNVAKHSGADNVNLTFEKSDNKIILVIKDNGHGFNVNTPRAVNESGGMGLFSMKERISFSGGKLFISSDEKNGTEIKGIWPLP